MRVLDSLIQYLRLLPLDADTAFFLGGPINVEDLQLPEASTGAVLGTISKLGGWMDDLQKQREELGNLVLQGKKKTSD